MVIRIGAGCGMCIKYSCEINRVSMLGQQSAVDGWEWARLAVVYLRIAVHDRTSSSALYRRHRLENIVGTGLAAKQHGDLTGAHFALAGQIRPTSQPEVFTCLNDRPTQPSSNALGHLT
jgi:hypothetical protein